MIYFLLVFLPAAPILGSPISRPSSPQEEAADVITEDDCEYDFQ